MNAARLTANVFALAGFAVTMIALLLAGFVLVSSSGWMAVAGILAFGYGAFFVAFMMKSWVDGMLSDRKKEPDGFNNLDNRGMRDGMYQ